MFASVTEAVRTNFHDFQREGENQILSRSASIWEMTSGKCLFSISGSTVVLARGQSQAEFHTFPREPVIHYCIGCLVCVVLPQSWVRIPVAAGVVANGVHGIFRLGGNSLMDCVTDTMLLTCRLLGTEVVRTTGLFSNQHRKWY